MLYERRSNIETPAAELFAWHLRPGAFERLTPPGDGTRVAERSGRIEENTMRVVLSVPVLGPIRQRWHVRHEGYIAGERFVDVMERGPFRKWRHEHRVAVVDVAHSELHDYIEYELPLGALARPFDGLLVRRRLDGMFDHRHAVTRDDLAAHGALAGRALTLELRGAPSAGTMGVAVAAFLATGGHELRGDVPLMGFEPGARTGAVDAVIAFDGRAVRVGSTAVDVGDDPVAGPRALMPALERIVALDNA